MVDVYKQSYARPKSREELGKKEGRRRGGRAIENEGFR